MKKALLSIAAFALISLTGYAQDSDKTIKEAATKPQEVKLAEDSVKKWTKGGFVGVNFGQVALVNWASGGQNTISIQLNANGFINYQSGRLAWDNAINFSLGGIIQGHVLDKRVARPIAFRKNVDFLQLTSRVGYVIDKKKQWMGAFLVDYKTSILNSYDYATYDADPSPTAVPQKISTPFSPSFLTLSLGVNYKPKPYVSFYLSPIAGKLSFVTGSTINRDVPNVHPDLIDETRYGMARGNTFRAEIGAYFRADFQKDIWKNINLKTTLELFQNYNESNKVDALVASNADAVKAKYGTAAYDAYLLNRPQTYDNRGNTDVNWLTTITFKVNKYITASLEAQLIYDHDVIVPHYVDGGGVRSGRGTQFREAFTLGIGYKFSGK
jgi:hypothetical protein